MHFLNPVVSKFKDGVQPGDWRAYTVTAMLEVTFLTAYLSRWLNEVRLASNVFERSQLLAGSQGILRRKVKN
jgi:hypothetical protein